MGFDAIIVLVTAPSMEVAHQVADVLLGERLAACVNIIPSIRSLYFWQAEKQDDAEVMMVIKSRAALFDEKLVPVVQAIHPYDVPEIIALPIILGSKSYLDWIDSETNL